MNPDGTVSSSLLKTLLRGEDAHERGEEEEEDSLASTEIEEHAAGDEASRSVAEEEEEEGKMAGERTKQLDPQSPCRLLCERHCASEATPRVAEGKKRKRKRGEKQTDEEETQTKDKQKRKKRQQRVSCCCPFAASKKCCNLEGDHIRRCIPMFCMPM